MNADGSAKRQITATRVYETPRPDQGLLAPLAVQVPRPSRCPAGAEVLIRPEETPARLRAEHGGQPDRARDHDDEEKSDEVHALD